MAAAQKALSILRSQPPSVFLASSLNATGVLFRLQRCYPEALASFSECETIYAALGDPVRQARAMINRANLFENIDRFSEAVGLLKQARETLAQNKTWLEVARADLNLGIVQSRLGRFEAALSAFQQSEEQFLALQNPMEAAVVRLYRADLYAEFNLYDDLLQEASRDQPIFTERQMQWQVGRASLHQAVAWRRRGDWLKASEFAASARALFEDLPDPLWSRLAILEQAQAWIETGGWSPALELALETAGFLRNQGMPVRAGQALLLAGRCCLALRRSGQAAVHFQQALDIASETTCGLLLSSAQYGLGQAAQQVGDWPAAYEHYRLAVEQIEDLRQNLTVEDFRAGFLEDKLEVYQAMVLACLNLGRQEEAFRYIERAKSGALVDLLLAALQQGAGPAEGDPSLLARLQELGQKLSWRYNQLNGQDESRGQAESRSEAELWVEIATLEQETTQTWRLFQQSHPLFTPLVSPLPAVLPGLAKDEVLLQYFITGQEIHAFVVDRSGLRTHRLLPASLEHIQQALNALENLMRGASAFSGGDPTAAPEALARQVLGWLYADLVQPLEGWLAQGARLRVAPDGVLFDVPFHALHDGEGYLLERSEVTSIPCAGVLELCRQATGRRLIKNNSALILGYTAGGRLTYVTHEVAAVKECLPGARVCLDEPDALAVLREQSGQCQVFHVAAHANFRRDNPLFSALQLSDRDWLRALDLYTLRLDGSLVTLSACQTGRLGLRGGDLLGLERGFFCAGAATQIGSLWLADDAAAASLMKLFYLYLVQGKTTAAALRQAQLDLRNLVDQYGKRAFTHPFYWAPFYLMGDPDLRLV